MPVTNVVALLPDGSSYSGKLLTRSDNWIWGFLTAWGQPMALPASTVLLPITDAFLVTPAYGVAKRQATRKRKPFGRILDRDVPAIQTGLPGLAPGHFGPAPQFRPR